MKKLAIAASSVALAALPMAGVFAVTSTNVVDNISAVVNPGCTIARGALTPASDFLDTASITVIAGGAAGSDATETVSITCSDPGWNVGIAPTTTGVVNLVDANSHQIAPGTAGPASYWNYAVTYTIGSGSPVVVSPTALTTAGASVITAETATAKTGSFTPTYTVSANSQQDAGTYTGSVTYTIASKAD